MENKGTPVIGPLIAGVVVGGAGALISGPLVGLIVGLVTFTLLLVLRVARRPA